MSPRRSVSVRSIFAAIAAAAIATTAAVAAGAAELRGTGDLGVVIERAKGRVQIVDTTARTSLGVVDGLGDLSHASVVYSRDGRYAYVFGRDGGLTKVDLLERRIAKRVMQAGNSIGGAVSQNGRVIAAQNYTPGGIKLFDAVTLELLADIPAAPGPDGQPSKVVGLADASGNCLPARQRGGSQTALAGDQLVLSIHAAHEHRLQEIMRLEAFRQRSDFRLAKVSPRLKGVLLDFVDLQVQQFTMLGIRVRRRGRNACRHLSSGFSGRRLGQRSDRGARERTFRRTSRLLSDLS